MFHFCEKVFLEISSTVQMWVRYQMGVHSQMESIINWGALSSGEHYQVGSIMTMAPPVSPSPPPRQTRGRFLDLQKSNKAFAPLSVWSSCLTASCVCRQNFYISRRDFQFFTTHVFASHFIPTYSFEKLFCNSAFSKCHYLTSPPPLECLNS